MSEQTSERSKQCEASKRVNGASEQANGQARGPVLMSRFLAVLNLAVRTTIIIMIDPNDASLQYHLQKYFYTFGLHAFTIRKRVVHIVLSVFCAPL